MMNPRQIVQSFANSANPMQMLSGLAQRNPIAHQAMQMMNGKTPAQMEQAVRQLAQQRGIDLDQLAAQAGVNLRK